MRVREFIPTGVRSGDGGTEHGTVQQRCNLRSLLRAGLREFKMVQARRRADPDNGYELLPSELHIATPLVQSAAEALRPVAVHVPEVRHIPGGNRAGEVPAGDVLQAWRDEVRDQGKPVVDSGAGVQRGRRRAGDGREGEGLEHGVDQHEPELGPALGDGGAAGRPEPIF